ncbi:LSU m3methyltransferase RlmH [Roseibacterium elongatum DSM 19469]|uniref:Ribosomal RNA large subunit methyltransferase H n=1 Tax=Roseicyclus elongatus DSM 19469 TaxID=1294273 RepID=W8RQJ1_9RHOB|nr:23S rRNA (pseudouridine(1915)-N(3))-methyltransferase RlmH [Roseibacterium elongatum]AHM03343.1 LSU m3methyltransferase RlmH [Roseibacterium elongatum DSM 19469]
MRIHLCVVGRLRKGPERSLVDDYLSRFDKTGRQLGLTLGKVIEVEDRKGGGMAAEADLLRRAIPQGSAVWVMDERGTTPSSPDFAQMLATLRDQGRGDLTLVIGGADGLDPSLRAEADTAISLGHMVWPHMLVRVMLSEQLYRAASILAGGPYHRA